MDIKWIKGEDRMNARAEVVYRGSVQGVWFRVNARRAAVEVGVTGTVRNLDDGTVEAVFEGEKERVEAAIVRCEKDQPHANVTGVDVIWGEWTGEFKAFRILR
jgi:acylphosphatase